jgi:hypothetical protein
MVSLIVLVLSVSEVIFPAQQLPSGFSHQKHLARHIGCDFCHEAAPGSRSAQDQLLPKPEVCETCHDAGFAPARALAEARIPAPNLRFDHAAHSQKGIRCQRCHGELTGVDLADRRQLPKMELCLECHDSRKAPLHAASRCQTCHLSRRDGILETQFPSGTLVPSGTLRGDQHGLSFRTQHAQVARADEKYCLNCHRQDWCQQCHNGVVKPLDFHGNDFVHRHAVDARRNTPDCQSCHRLQSFCLGCHERLGIVDARTGVGPAFQPLGTRSFHPQGWADPNAAGNPNHHAWQAQRNLRQCVSCHRQETCLECHGSTSRPELGGKQQVNPHPPGFGRSPRCTSLADRNLRVCLRCHGPADSHLQCR